MNKRKQAVTCALVKGNDYDIYPYKGIYNGRDTHHSKYTSYTCMLQTEFLDNLGEERASSLSKIFYKLFTRGRVGLE